MRPNGFYWVKWLGTWDVLYWEQDHWLQVASDEWAPEDELEIIGPRIEPPTEAAPVLRRRYTGPISVAMTFVWATHIPHATQTVTVTKIKDIPNDERMIYAQGRDGKAWPNDESYFREMCTPTEAPRPGSSSVQEPAQADLTA